MSSIALGRNLLIKKGEAVLAGLRTVNWSWAGSSIDITAGEINGFRALLDGSEQEQLDLSVDGIAKNAVLRKLALGMESRMLTDITITWPVNAPGDIPESISGNFRISSYSEGAPYKDAITFSAKLESSGPWVYVGGTAGGGDGGGDGGEPDPDPVARGSQNILGLNKSGEGDYPALTPVYNFDDDAVDVYQRVCVYDNVGAELTEYALTALDGDYCVCLSYDEYGSGNSNKIFIATHKKNAEIVSRSGWEVTDYLTIGADVDFIDLGNNPSGDPYLIIGVFVLAPGIILIHTRGQHGPSVGGLNSFSAQCSYFVVEYSSPIEFTVNEYVLDLADFGDLAPPDPDANSGWSLNAMSSIAFDTEIKRLSIRFACLEFPFYNFGSAVYRVRYADGFTVSKQVYASASVPARPEFTKTDYKCVALKQLGEDVLHEGIVDFIIPDAYSYGYQIQETAFDNRRVQLGLDGVCNFYEYSGRTITNGADGSATQHGQLNYIDEAGPFEIDMQAKYDSKMISLGFDVVDFGAQAIFFDINV